MSAALVVAGLKKSFGGVAAVRGIDFTVHAGEAVALIGPNGAGKTTTFNLVNGQIAPDAGRVTLAGDDITGLAPEALFRRGVARTFQITATFASMTVRENVQMALASHARHTPRTGAGWGRYLGWMPAAHAARAQALIDEQGLSADAARPASELAYGDLKRLELAMAFANAPRLLLMDEPTAGMAPNEREALMRTAVAACRERGVALLFTEHDMDVVFGFADRVVVMNRGRIIAEGSPDAVQRNDEVRAVYLGGQPVGAGRGHA
ncbi:MAG: ABC transporter ATP-binding protein [Burkholderiales bacterium]|nr:ABC transporter ATP-binding protein [Burkholderiales bacterium]